RGVLFLITLRFYAFTTSSWWDNSAMNQKQTSIYLIGMMGSGKSTIGKVLARVLHMPFVDLDQQIEAKCGVKIPVIFEIEGEEGFRKREAQVLEEVSLQPG